MKSLLLVTIAVMPWVKTYSQEENEIRLKAGHSINEYLTRSQRFRYDQFKEGRIYYESGKVSQTHKFNYDLLNGRMLVIQLGDTVPIVPIEEKIKFYKIENEVYLNWDKDEIVEILTTDSIMLGVNSKYIVKRRETISSNGYGSGYDAMGAAQMRGGCIFARCDYCKINYILFD